MILTYLSRESYVVHGGSLILLVSYWLVRFSRHPNARDKGRGAMAYCLNILKRRSIIDWTDYESQCSVPFLDINTRLEEQFEQLITWPNPISTLSLKYGLSISWISRKNHSFSHSCSEIILINELAYLGDSVGVDCHCCRQHRLSSHHCDRLRRCLQANIVLAFFTKIVIIIFYRCPRHDYTNDMRWMYLDQSRKIVWLSFIQIVQKKCSEYFYLYVMWPHIMVRAI